MFKDAEKAVVVGAVGRTMIAKGLVTQQDYDAAVKANTAVDGTVNWAGVITFLNDIVAELPAILSILAAFGI
jgi:hypothetical protein